MSNPNKTQEELLKIIEKLQQENNSLKALHQQDIRLYKEIEQNLTRANKELDSQNKAKEKRAKELIQAKEKAEKNEANLSFLFKNVTVGIVVLSREGRIQFTNPYIEKLFGYSNTELIGQPIEVLIPQSFKKTLEHYSKNIETPPIEHSLNLFTRRKDEHEFHVEINLGHYQVGNESLIVAFITDVTKIKRNQEELEEKVRERTLKLTESLEREKELNTMKSRFVSMASHEFRTPLTAILSSISLIDSYKKEEQEGKRKKHVERIKSSVKNLIDILNDFLSLEKLEQGKTETLKEEFDLYEFSKEIIEEVNVILKQGQRINFIHNGGKKVVQDKKILRNVLLNLLSNAIKYSGENKEIFFLVDVSDVSTLIKIKDEGIGISEEDQKNIFEKFFRAKNANNIQGTGLGLHIVKRYVELLEGTISFTSKLEEGTTFNIIFRQNNIK